MSAILAGLRNEREALEQTPKLDTPNFGNPQFSTRNVLRRLVFGCPSGLSGLLNLSKAETKEPSVICNGGYWRPVLIPLHRDFTPSSSSQHPVKKSERFPLQSFMELQRVQMHGFP